MRIDTKTWALLPFAVALNVVMGWTAAPLPIHLDSLGTCLAAALAGPAAGMITGAAGNILSALQNPIWLRYFPVAVLIGALVGVLTRWRMMNSAFLACVGGLLVGICSASLAAPITAWSGGASGGGTDLLIAAFREMGYSKLSACFAESLMIDPLDKMFSCAAVYAFLAVMPAKMRMAFPNGAALNALRPWRSFFTVSAAPSQTSEPRHTISGNAPKLGLYMPGSSVWHRAAPGTKLLLVACSLAACFFVPGWVEVHEPQHAWYPLPYYPLLLSALFAAAVSIGAGSELGRLLLWTALPAGLAITVINGLWGQSDSIAIGPLRWSAASACQASTLAMGLTLITESVGLLFITTPIYDLCRYLESRGVSSRLSYTLLASLNLIPSLQRRAVEIREAQESRGMPVGSGFQNWRRTFLPFLIPLLLSAVADAQERALTLETRGFGTKAKRTSWTAVQAPRSDIWLQALIIAVFLLVGACIYL